MQAPVVIIITNSAGQPNTITDNAEAGINAQITVFMTWGIESPPWTWGEEEKIRFD
jgi:hypothetical protein